MTEKEKRFKIKKIEKYNDEIKSDERKIVMSTVAMGLITLLFVINADLFKDASAYGKIVEYLKYITNGLLGYRSFKILRIMIEKIVNKISLTRKIEDLKFELEFEEELEKEEEGKKL